MNKCTLIMPSKIRVGYQDREDTYTKRLAFITYFDSKNNLRQQKSFENWRDKKIDTNDYENTPTEDFVLNKGVGGISYSRWDSRREKVRVYDPRGFEFEITVDNVLLILSYCDCIKGKGLEGEFIYAWDGSHIVLLPVDSPEYQQSKEYTTILSTTKILAKDLVPGYTYLTKDRYSQKELIYVGRVIKYEHFDKYLNKTKSKRSAQKVYFFYSSYEIADEKRYKYYYFKEVGTKLLKVISEEVIPEYTDHLETHFTSDIGSKALSISVIKHPKKHNYSSSIKPNNDGSFFVSFDNFYSYNRYYSVYGHTNNNYKVYIDELGCVRIETNYSSKPFIPSTEEECLCVEFEGGTKYVDVGHFLFEKLVLEENLNES